MLLFIIYTLFLVAISSNFPSIFAARSTCSVAPHSTTLWQIDGSSHSLNITWDQVPAPSDSSYVNTYTLTMSSTTSASYNTIYEGPNTFFVVNELTPSSSVRFQVFVSCPYSPTRRLSSTSSGVVSITLASPTSSPPSFTSNSLMGTPVTSSGSMRLSWDPASVDGKGLDVFLYQVRIVSRPSTSPSLFGILFDRTYTSTSPSLSVTGLDESVTYDVTVRAKSNAGFSTNTLDLVITPTSSMTSVLAATGTNNLANCLNSCSGNGFCTSANTCKCNIDFLSADCSVPAQAPLQMFGTSQGTGVFYLQFKVANGQLHIRMISPTQGYISFLLNHNGDGMTGGVDWAAFFPNAKDAPVIQEEFSPGLFTPTKTAATLIDPKSVSGLMNATHVEVLFSRKLAGTGNLPTISTNGSLLAAWAIGSSQTYNYHSGSGKFSVNLVTGAAVAVPAVTYSFTYIPPLVFLGVIILFGILMISDRIRKGTALGRIITLWRPFSSVSKRSALDDLTLDARQTTQDLAVSEILVTLAWLATNIVIFIFGTKTFNDAGKDPTYVWSHILSINFAATLLPITRNSVFGPIFGSSFERFIRIHRWLGRITFVCLYLHALYMTKVFGNRWLENMTLPYGASVVSGTISFIALNLLVVTSIESVRRSMFEVFYHIHLVCFAVSVAFGMIHSYHFRMEAIIPLSLYGIDRIVRFLRSMRGAQLVDMKVHTAPDLSTVTELKFQIDGFKYEAGSYVFLSIPLISFLEWHPISISSADTGDGTFTLHIQDVDIGTWTNHLSQYGRRYEAGLFHSSRLWFRVDGPHGKLSLNPHKYRVVVLAGGGIGITPMISLALELEKQMKSQGDSEIKAVHIFWTSKQEHHLEEWFAKSLQSLVSNPLFHFHLYATAKVAPKGGYLSMTQSFRSFPSPTAAATTNNYNNNYNGINSGLGSSLSPPAVPEVYVENPAAAAAADMGDWVEYEDEYDNYSDYGQRAKRKYWYNAVTGETSWTPPFPKPPPAMPPKPTTTATALNTSNSRSPPPVPPPALTASRRGSWLQRQAARVGGLIRSTRSLEPAAAPLSPSGMRNNMIRTRISIYNTAPALSNKIRSGRPDIDKVFDEIATISRNSNHMSNEILGRCDTDVGVFVCGPNAFMDAIHRAAVSRDWHLHKETFGF